jgi:hypothetical protein
MATNSPAPGEAGDNTSMARWPLPKRPDLFADPQAAVVWPAVMALSEAALHDLLRELQLRLAVPQYRDTPQRVREARAVAAYARPMPARHRTAGRGRRNGRAAGLVGQRLRAPPRSSPRAGLAAEGDRHQLAGRIMGVGAAPRAPTGGAGRLHDQDPPRRGLHGRGGPTWPKSSAHARQLQAAMRARSPSAWAARRARVANSASATP